MAVGWSKLGRPARLLVTGSTGFIGSFLVESFLRRGCKVHCVVRASAKGAPSPASRIESAVHMVNPRAPVSGLSTLEGDITQPVAGLSKSDLDHLKGQIDEIWHCAAETSFDPALRRKTFVANLDGTRNMIDLAETIDCPSFCLLSTAYVSDQTQDLVAEEPVRNRKTFRNPYEESKLGAENCLLERSNKSGYGATIYRLPVVTGHSVTGRTTQFLGYYFYARVFLDLKSKLVKRFGDGAPTSGQIRFVPSKLELPGEPQGYLELPIRIYCGREATVNMLPVDLVVETLNRCADAERDGNLILHLTNGKPPRVQFLFEETLELLGFRRFRIENLSEGVFSAPDATQDSGDVLASLEREIYSASLPYLPYTLREAVFSRKNLESLIGPEHLPDFEVSRDYLRKILEFAVLVWGEKNRENF